MRIARGVLNRIKFGEITSQKALGACLEALDAGVILIIGQKRCCRNLWQEFVQGGIARRRAVRRNAQMRAAI